MPVHIADYDPQWPRLFALEYDRLLPTLGPWALGLEHTGSTAVRGLAAKPVIDLLLGVRSLQDADAHCVPALQALGYTYVPAAETSFPDRRFFTRHSAEGTRTHHVHCVQQGSAFWRDHLFLRDYLRAQPEVAADYAAHKRALAPLHSTSESYSAAKGSFIVPRLQAARLWRASTARVLRTARLQLRLWEDSDSDLAALAALNGHAQVMQFMPQVLSQKESAEILQAIRVHFCRHGFGLWAVCKRGESTPLGWTGLAVPNFAAAFTPCVEIAWRLQPQHWGQGLATEAARAALAFAFAQLQLLEVVSFTVPANLRSRRVMDKLGMLRNPHEDFEHPALPAHHPLRTHLLYRLPRADLHPLTVGSGEADLV